MSVQLLTKWYGIHKLQETMASLQVELARLSSDPGDKKPGRHLVRRVELKMADVLAALQWFEYHNKLDVDVDRLERDCERYDAYHLKPVTGIPGQTYMNGIVTCESDLVSTLTENEPEPETLPSSANDCIDAGPASAERSNGSR